MVAGGGGGGGGQRGPPACRPGRACRQRGGLRQRCRRRRRRRHWGAPAAGRRWNCGAAGAGGPGGLRPEARRRAGADRFWGWARACCLPSHPPASAATPAWPPAPGWRTCHACQAGSLSALDCLPGWRGWPRLGPLLPTALPAHRHLPQQQQHQHQQLSLWWAALPAPTCRRSLPPPCSSAGCGPCCTWKVTRRLLLAWSAPSRGLAAAGAAGLGGCCSCSRPRLRCMTCAGGGQRGWGGEDGAALGHALAAVPK
jgi:hypothetical protein